MFQSIIAIPNDTLYQFLYKTKEDYFIGTINTKYMKPYYSHKIDNVHCYNYKITDDILGTEDVVGYCRQELFFTEVRAGAVINFYHKHNQDIAYNLFRYHRYLEDKYAWYEIEKEIQYNRDLLLNMLNLPIK